MRFLFGEEAGAETLSLRGETYKYLVKVRRQGVGETVALRHPEHPETLYRYRIDTIEGRRAGLTLLDAERLEIASAAELHIGWCVIDPKSVEKVLPQLNEMGVARITFIYCDRSQKQFKMDFRRLERILENSMQQCGRSTKMQLGEAASLEAFIAAHPETVVFDFCETILKESAGIGTVLIGCEGGFSEAERGLLSQQKTFRLATPMILRSETAVAAVAAKILL